MNASNTFLSSVSQHSELGALETSAYSVFVVDSVANDPQGGIAGLLGEQNFTVLGVVPDMLNLNARVRSMQPDVVIVSVDFLDASTLAQLIHLHEDSPVPVVVFAQRHTHEILRPMLHAGVSAYVVDDLQARRLPVIVDIAIERFKHEQSLNMQLSDAKSKLEERKLVERAKGIIMQQKKLSENEAYSQMRRSAMNQGQTITELAKRIISVYEMLA